MQGASFTSARTEVTREQIARAPIPRIAVNAVSDVFESRFRRAKEHSCCYLHYMQPETAA